MNPDLNPNDGRGKLRYLQLALAMAGLMIGAALLSKQFAPGSWQVIALDGVQAFALFTTILYPSQSRCVFRRRRAGAADGTGN